MNRLKLEKLYSNFINTLYVLLAIPLGILSSIYASYLFMVYICPILLFEITIHNNYINQAIGIVLLGVSFGNNEVFMIIFTILFVSMILVKKTIIKN